MKRVMPRAMRTLYLQRLDLLLLDQVLTGKLVLAPVRVARVDGPGASSWLWPARRASATIQ